MTFFYRGPSGRIARRSTFGMRLASALALIAYPLGGAAVIAAPDAAETGLVLGEAVWLGCLLLTIASLVWMAPSYLQRIAGDEAKNLDEFELDLRRRAYAFAYQAFAALTLAGLIYLASALDFMDGRGIELWRPQTFDHWNAIIWGTILYAFVLPTAYLAWAAPAPELEEEGEA